MDALEEQALELEVLESIYPDELERISGSHFNLSLPLDTASERNHRIILEVKYPPEYPEVVPDLSISATADFEDSDENSDDEDNEDSKALTLAETIEFEKNDINSLLGKANQEAEAQIGMPSVFSLATFLKDEAESLFQKKLDEAQKVYDRKILAREKEEQKKFHGTKVTKASWSEWRDKFRKEMHVADKDRERFEEMHHGKLTGKQIFEQGLAGNDDDITKDISENVKAISVS